MSNFQLNANAVISDLGCSIKLKSPTEMLTYKMGTPGYTAPEMIKGKAYSFPADIWSLGCLLYVMLTATPPFWEQDRTKRNHRVCTEPLNFLASGYLSQLSPQARDILSQMLAKDPAQRPSIDQVLAHDWLSI